MAASPLTLQERPATFQPKIARLYEELFQHDDQATVGSVGFWKEFFLLKPDRPRLQGRLESLESGDLLDLQRDSQQLFRQAVLVIKQGKEPMDENGLDVRNLAQFITRLTTYLSDPSCLLECHSV